MDQITKRPCLNGSRDAFWRPLLAVAYRPSAAARAPRAASGLSLGEDRPQRAVARRERVTVIVNCPAQQSRERDGFFLG